MKKSLFFILFLTMLLGITAIAWGATLAVPGTYTTIQAAIAAANPAGGDVIEVGPGIYSGNLVINKNLTLLSTDGAATTIIDGNTAGSDVGAVLLTTGRNGVTIGSIDHGFTIKGIDGTPGLEKAALYMQGVQSNITIEGNIIEARGDYGLMGEYNASNNNIVINANSFTGKTFNGDHPAGVGFTAQFSLANVPRQLVVLGGGASTTNTQNVTFTNNIISGIAGGTSVTDNSGNPIAATPQGNTMITLDLVGTNLISGNTISGTTTRYAEALRMRGAGTYNFGSNVFNGSYPVVVSATTTVPAVGLARIADLISSSTFDKSVQIYASGILAQPYVYQSITAAVAAAVAGQEVRVSAGTFNENVTIDKSLTLNGANANVPFGSRGPESIVQDLTQDDLPVFTAAANGVTINGFEVIDPYANSGIDAGLTGYSDWNIKFNYIHNIGSSRGSGNIYGIRYNVGNTNTSNINISDNYIDNVGNATTTLGNIGGIWFGQSTSNGIVNGVDISRNTITNVKAALAAKGAWGITIGTGWDAGTGNLTNLVISHNNISNIAGGYVQAIDLEGETYGTFVSNNNISSLSSLVAGQTVGLWVASTNPGAMLINAHYNKFTGMAAGIGNGSTATFDATLNYWGDASGPYQAVSNTDGLGAVCSNYVNYDPWWANAQLTTLGSNAPIHNTIQGIYYTSIQEAITAAVNGDVIEINGGTYDETLNIEGKNNLTLRGVGARTLTIIKPSTVLPWNAFGYTTNRSTAIRVVNSNNLMFDNITLDCDLIKNNGYYGVLYGDCTGGTFQNSVFKNMYTDTSHYYDIMVAIRTTTYTALNRATVSFLNNQFIDTGRVGILLHNFADALIQGNAFYKTTRTFGYAMELGSASIATVRGNTIYGFDTPAVSDGSSSGGIYVENAFTTGGAWDCTKTVAIDDNDIYNCQLGVTVGNQFNNYAGNVDIVMNFTNNNIYDNLDAGILITDEDRANGSSVTATLTDNTITTTRTVAGDAGLYVYANGDAALNITTDSNDISGFDYGVLVYNWGTKLNSVFTASLTGNDLTGNSYGLYAGDVNWTSLPTITGNTFGDNPVQIYNEGAAFNMPAIQSANTWPGGYFNVGQVIYSYGTSLLYVDAPKQLIRDNEMQVYSVKANSISNLRGYTVEIQVPKAYFSAPTNFTLGSSYPSNSSFIWLDISDTDNWIFDVSGAVDGVYPGGITGNDVTLFTCEISSLPNVSNVPAGSLIELPMDPIMLFDMSNPFNEIVVEVTDPILILIDSTEPTIVQNNPLVYPSGMILPIDPVATVANGYPSVTCPVLNLTVSDDYNINYAKYLIQGSGAPAPTAIAGFASGTDMITSNFAGATSTFDFTAPAAILNAAVNNLADGSYTIYFLGVDDAGNYVITAWSFVIDKSACDPVTWVQCRVTPNANNSIDLTWTNPVGAVRNQIWVLDYDFLASANGYPEYNPVAFSVPAIPAAPNPYNPAVQNGWTKMADIAAPTAFPYAFTITPRGYYYLTVFAVDTTGNISAAPAAPFYRQSLSYWPGDVTATADTSQVTIDDIALLSTVWGLTSASDSWNPIIDVGPSVDHGRLTRPSPDNKINLEDMMVFSMNWENTNYYFYNRNSNDQQPVRIALQSAYENNLLRVDVRLADNNSTVKGLDIPFNYGSGLTLQSVTAGSVWSEHSLLLYTNENNVLDISCSELGGDTVLEGNGIVATAYFSLTGNENTLNLQHMIARDINNADISIVNNPGGTTPNGDQPTPKPVADVLGNNYPNPFNPATTINFGLKDAGSVLIRVFNTQGQLVKTLVNANKAAGYHTVVWDGTDNNNHKLASGVYFYRMETKNHAETRKAILLK